MSAQDSRFAIGIDTCLLQVVDSFLNAVPYGRFATTVEPYRCAPNARAQFVEAVDAYLDPVGCAVVLPQESLGHLGPIGTHLASGMTLLKNALTTAPIERGTGIDFYQRFLRAVAEEGTSYRQSFRDSAINWALFQLQDRDVLLGYHDRMSRGAGGGEVFVKVEMVDQFTEAYLGLDEPTRERLATRTDLSLRDAGGSLEQFHGFVRGLRGCASSDPKSARASPLADIVLEEVGSYRYKGQKLGPAPQDPVALFALAYAGSVARRGWQYIGAYGAEGTAAQLAQATGASGGVRYHPHDLRRAFIGRSLDACVSESGGRHRLYPFSFGHLIATALEQFPTMWDADRLCRQLDGLKADLLDAGWPLSVDDPPPPTGLPDERLRELIPHWEAFVEIAQRHDLLVLGDTDQRVGAFIRVAVRMAPYYGTIPLVGALGSAFGLGAAYAGALAGYSLKNLVGELLKVLGRDAEARSRTLWGTLTKPLGDRLLYGLKRTSDAAINFLCDAAMGPAMQFTSVKSESLKDRLGLRAATVGGAIGTVAVRGEHTVHLVDGVPAS